MKQKEASNMFLNASVIDKAKLLMRFPTISKKCLSNGIDISSTPIPVAPAAHYSMGGVKATVEGRTSLRGLYAIGEVASIGLHGANRLASNSLLECVVCAYELSDYLSFANLTIPKKIDNEILSIIKLYDSPLDETSYDISKLKSKLKDIMWSKVGIVRSEESLTEARKEIQNLKSDFKRNRKCLNHDEYEYRNMLTVAGLIVEAALERKESRGAHSRSDYKLMNEDAIHSSLKKLKMKELAYVK
jgi:L-aspartate oxidase